MSFTSEDLESKGIELESKLFELLNDFEIKKN